MAKRIDALGDNRARLAALTGRVLSREVDRELQECVERAAKELKAPIALVSLVLEHTQFFRAHHGLPPDLEAARATDRDGSFCQFVVRDGEPFEVNDAGADDRVPTDLVERYGIGAYFGVPVVVDHHTVGSLCVIDGNARNFDASDKKTLLALSKVVSARLEVLAKQTPDPRDQLMAAGLKPAFAEIRNRLVPLVSAAHGLRLVLADLQPIVELAESDISDAELARGLGALRRSLSAVSDLGDLADEIEFSARSLVETTNAVEKIASVGAANGELRQIVEVGLELAHHITKLRGPVELGTLPSAQVRCTISRGGALVSLAASMLAGTASGPLVVSGRIDGSVANVVLTGGSISSELAAEIVERLEVLSSDLAVHCEAVEGGLCLRFDLAPGFG